MIRTWSSIGVALLWLLSTIGRGAEPAAAPGYILLRDLAVLRGMVDEEPGRVVIRYQGAEIRMSREKVACWADSLDGLYQYQLDRRRVFTVESHLDAARWCLRHGLCDRAAAEIVAAGRLRPGAPQIQRVEAELRLALERRARPQLAAEENPDPPGLVPPSSAAAGPGAESLVSDQEAELSELLDGIGENGLREFNLRIQPLLANRCSATACHGEGAAAAWVLMSEPAPGRRPTAAMTQQNLAAVLPWVNREHPTASPLLVRALKPHGGSEEPPLGARDQAAIENLRRWIDSLPNKLVSASEDASQIASRSGASMSPAGSQVEHSLGDTVSNTVRSTAGKGTQPVRLPDVADPFDPDLFNRRFHPSARVEEANRSVARD